MSEGNNNNLDDLFDTVRRSAQRSMFASQGGAAPLEAQFRPNHSLNSARLNLANPAVARKAVSGGVSNALAGLTGGGGTASWAKAPQTTDNVQRIVRDMAERRGWSGKEWDALYGLIQRESGWKPTAANPTSSAYGLFQFLDSTRKNYGITRDAPLTAQIEAGLRYIQDRYKTPSAALQHWLAKKPINGKNVGHWY